MALFFVVSLKSVITKFYCKIKQYKWLLTLTSAQIVHRDFADTVDNIENLVGFNFNIKIVQYEYQYSVDEGHAAGPVMGRWEKRLGDYVKGTYSFLGPDNMVRTVDYEVDGPSGYKAIQRLNPFVPDLLSVKQLHNSEKYFPHSLPSPKDSAPIPKKHHTGEELHNYHAFTPYWNLRATINDQKTAASVHIDPLRLTSPKSPANYNVDIPKKVIHWQTPATKILESKKHKESFKPFESLPFTKYSNTITQAFIKPLKKDSKLVKRFKSFEEVIGSN